MYWASLIVNSNNNSTATGIFLIAISAKTGLIRRVVLQRIRSIGSKVMASALIPIGLSVSRFINIQKNTNGIVRSCQIAFTGKTGRPVGKSITGCTRVFTWCNI